MVSPGIPDTRPLESRQRIRLDTLPRCRRELSKLYAEARTGRLEPQSATRLASIVALVARLIEGSELEQRLERLEQGVGPER